MPGFLSVSCLGLLALLFCFISFTECVVYTSSGTSGTACGPEGVHCLTSNQAVCNGATGTCNCFRRRFPAGDGRLTCYRESEFQMEVYNDPVLHTINRNAIDAPFPCRYLFVHVLTGLYGKGRNQLIGRCTSQVSVFHYKDKGKPYVGGVDIGVFIKYDNGPNYKASLRITGSAYMGTYTYTVLGNDGVNLPDGPFGNDEINYIDNTNKIKARILYDENNNIVLFTIKKCGFRVRFRAYDVYLRRNQTQIPGVIVAINRNTKPVWFQTRDKTLSMVPKDFKRGYTIDDILLPGLGRKETLLNLALTTGVAQTQPESNAECAASAAVLATCTDTERATAYTNCYWMLKVPRFIKRYDNSTSGEGIMGLFNRCLEIYCNNGNCNDVIDLINNSDGANVQGYAELDDFKNGGKCP